MRITINDQMVEKLTKVSNIVGKPVNVIVQEAINRAVLQYQGYIEEEPRKALMYPTEYEVECAISNGRDPLPPKEVLVYGSVTVFGNSYYKVSYDGLIAKCPAYCIKFI